MESNKNEFQGDAAQSSGPGASGVRFAPVADDGDQALQPPIAPAHNAVEVKVGQVWGSPSGNQYTVMWRCSECVWKLWDKVRYWIGTTEEDLNKNWKLIKDTDQ